MFGNYLKLSIRGASHARKMTFALENFPAGFPIDEAALKDLMERRAPGRDKFSTQRRETDAVSFRSGVRQFGEGRLETTGGMILGEIASVDMRPKDYGAERTVPRPGHADFGQWVQFGRIPTGGGKNSGRLTAPLCAAGGLCQQFLLTRGIVVRAELASVGGETDSAHMLEAIERARLAGDSVGGSIVCTIENVPVGLGGPLEEGLESAIAAAVFAIPGVKGITFGAENCTELTGSQYNDAFIIRDGAVATATNRQGGILGGRANGGPIVFRAQMRPTPTVFKPQESVDLATMSPATCETKGRHDPCIVRRAVPVVEAAAALALADALLADEATHARICLTLTGRTLEADFAQFASQRYFADIVELRVDLLRKSDRPKVARALVDGFAPTLPVVVTFRRKVDGGAFEGSESERLAFFGKLLSALEAQPASRRLYVDLEEGFGDAALVARARAAGFRVIRSVHAFDGPVRNLPARLRALAKAGDVAKVAFMPKTEKDVAKLFAQLARPGLPPHVVCAMGPLGLPTRVLAARLGSLWTYASVGGLGQIGHLSPENLVRDYRIRAISKAAAVVRVPADRVAETNAAFLREDEDCVALPK